LVINYMERCIRMTWNRKKKRVNEQIAENEEIEKSEGVRRLIEARQALARDRMQSVLTELLDMSSGADPALPECHARGSALIWETNWGHISLYQEGAIAGLKIHSEKLKVWEYVMRIDLIHAPHLRTFLEEKDKHYRFVPRNRVLRTDEGDYYTGPWPIAKVLAKEISYFSSKLSDFIENKLIVAIAAGIAYTE